MNKKYIIKKSAEFSKIINKKKRLSSKYYTIYYIENNYDNPRFGISIGKKNANAVLRNKNKRQTKEIIVKLLKTFNYNVDCIIIMKKDGIEKSFIEKTEDLNFLFQKLSKKE